MNTLESQKKLVLVTFLIIPVSMLLLFVVYPTLRMLQLSFTDWDGLKDSMKYIGLLNYQDMLLKSPEVWVSLRNNLLYFLGHGVLIPFELVIAVILESKIRGSKFFKTISFLPYIINGVAVAYIFSFFFSSYGGTLNMILQAMGLDNWIQPWLGNPNLVNYTLVSITVWRYAGFHIIIFLAGLQSVPQELYEAAMVDGANAVQRFFKITIPSLWTVIEIVLFLHLRGCLQIFDIPFLITRGGPGYASTTFSLHTINTAFTYHNFGMASAMGINLLLMIVIFSSLQQKILNVKKD
jgi:raffinose/stachyose/melibiose transport system permease protein